MYDFQFDNQSLDELEKIIFVAKGVGTIMVTLKIHLKNCLL